MASVVKEDTGTRTSSQAGVGGAQSQPHSGSVQMNAHLRALSYGDQVAALTPVQRTQGPDAKGSQQGVSGSPQLAKHGIQTVSYTHLTLPTSDLV